MCILKTENLNKRVTDAFGLKDINLQINEGEFVSIIGQNGAGKTTLLRILSGLSKFDSGKVTICNIPINKSRKVNQYLGIVQQSKGMPDTLTVEEYIKFQSRLRSADPNLLNKLIDTFDIKKFYNQQLSTLSGGNLRKLHIMIAIMHNPKIVIMDEPTVGLDPVVRNDMWNFIKELKKIGISVLISTHYLDEAEALGDKIIILNNGEIVNSGNVEDVKKEYAKDYGLTIEFVDKEEAEKFINIINDLKIPFVKSVSSMLNVVKVYTDVLEYSYLPRLVGFIKEYSLKITGIEFFKLTLEEILLAIGEN
ncbi:ABC transporter ATP-binding protein [Clostridium botulinum]|uniref:ABC transporter ATP-binding protein n=1 Tax=Clostridium botulinum TaxID=1491 RepID=UPI00067D80BA|nr:ABC transporter ATP-binding protein [Clostridium botulinum]